MTSNPTNRLYLRAALLLAVLSGLTIPQAGQATQADGVLSAGPVVHSRPGEIVSEPVRSFLKRSGADSVLIWVYFTDKQVFTQNEFDRMSSRLDLGERASLRRRKVQLDHVVFADLPVAAQYVERVIDRGARHRRSSRWLNAASFVVTIDAMDRIAELPFVSSIRPVAEFSRSYGDEESQALKTAPGQSLGLINYGESEAQLSQIGVPYAHQLGLNGQGVTLAILDTGFKRSHEAFAAANSEGRVLAEYDFIFNDDNTDNEPIDDPNQSSHGTSVWSVAGGEADGILYGPAYGANFLLAKTEDERSETPVEEDNWVAAMEWSDSLGADVITTSLGYSDWYTYEDYDGETATITIAANTAASLGIVVCNSAGNGGPGAGTITPPADAFESMACGSVDAAGNIASSSSRGPTYDGRIKPELCARGVGTLTARHFTNQSYGARGGTSFAAPLVAGAVCILIQARPDYTPQMIRQALLETASQADSPNNTFGWGIVNLEEALRWGVDFAADITYGEPPLIVQFGDESTLSPAGWHWEFGDGGESFDQNPIHTYEAAGIYDVSLTVQTAWGDLLTTRTDLVVVSADTVFFGSDSAYAGAPMVSSASMTNGLPLEDLRLTFDVSTTPLDISLDSVKPGIRTIGFDNLSTTVFGSPSKTWSVRLFNDEGTTFTLEPGSGEILKLFFSTDDWDDDLQVNSLDTSLAVATVSSFTSEGTAIRPVVVSGQLSTRNIVRGDFDMNGKRSLADITALIGLVYLHGGPPKAMSCVDLVIDHKANLADITNLIGFVYLHSPDPDLQ